MKVKNPVTRVGRICTKFGPALKAEITFFRQLRLLVRGRFQVARLRQTSSRAGPGAMEQDQARNHIPR